MADNTSKSNIDDIVSGVQQALKSGELSDGGVKFEFFDEDSEENSFTFEIVEPKEEKAEEISPAPEPEPKTEQIAEEEPILEEPSKEPEPELSSSIFTTYVPKFTEASESYRMKNGADEESERPEPTPVKQRENPLFDFEDDTEAVDPTAELEGESISLDATAVTSGNSIGSDDGDISTVFKFDSGDALDFLDPEPEPPEVLFEEPAVEEEPEKEEETVIEEEPEVIETPAVEENKPYVMPDPVFKETKVNLPEVRKPVSLELIDESVNKKKHFEYTSFTEKDGFFDNFLDSIMSIRVRIVAVFMLALMVLAVENASVVGVDLIAFFHFEGVGGAMAILVLPFIVGIFFLVLPEVVYSFTSLIKKKLVPEIFLTVSFAVVILYYAVIILRAATEEYFLLGFMFALIAILTLFASYYKKKADFIAFKIASANGEKKVVDRKFTRNLPPEHRALDGKIESYKSRTARVFKTSFVSDFAARSSIISENSVGNAVILFGSLGIAIVGGVVAFFIPGGIICAAMTFALVYMLAIPAFVLVSHKIPFYQATAEANRENTALIGEKTFYDYAGVDVITFDDTEMFGKDDVNLQRIMVYGRKENLPKALQQMSALFTVVGGPLAYIFANAVDRRVSPADNVAVDTDGVIGSIDGVEVMAGSAEFMARRGVVIPADPEGETTPSQTTRIMYASEGGEIYAKFYIRYMLSEDFTMILPLLVDDGVSPLVYTRDPNINDGLFRSLTAGSDAIRVLKKQNLPENENRLYRRISLGMVSLGDKNNIINSLLLAKKYASFQARLALAELPVMIGGAMLGLVAAICLPLSIPSAILSLWYICWSTIAVILGKRLFGRKKDKMKDKD